MWAARHSIEVVVPREGGGHAKTPSLRISPDVCITGPPVCAGGEGNSCGSKIRHIFADRRGAPGAEDRARRPQCRCAGCSARRRQDHARAAGPARRSLGEGQQDSGAGAAQAGGARSGRRAWRRRSASRSATPSACACASARKITKRTRIEVVTEGVFTRLVLDDPSLEGVAAVLFDEFHERSLDADLGLALARDAQQGLRAGPQAAGHVGDA